MSIRLVTQVDPYGCQLRIRLLTAVVASLLAITTVAEAQQIGALLTGYEESPSVSTTGRGACLRRDSIPEMSRYDVPFVLTALSRRGMITNCFREAEKVGQH